MNGITPESREIRVYEVSLTEKTLIMFKGFIPGHEHELDRIMTRLNEWIKDDDNPMIILCVTPGVEIALEKIE